MTAPATTPTAGPSYRTIRDRAGFVELARPWDELVRALPRPSPFLLHGWLAARWDAYAGEREFAVEAAFADGRLVGAFPIELRRRGPLRVASAIGAQHSALADLLLAPTAPSATAERLVAGLARAGGDYVDVFGVPEASRLRAAAGPSLHWIERVDAPVLSMPDGWEAAYRSSTPSKRRNLHRRRRRQLAELGELELRSATSEEELAAALEDAFALHDLRWAGRPDGSEFTTPTGKRFHRAAVRALARDGVARILTLSVDGRALAFHYWFQLEGVMYVHRLAFDPAAGRLSPGIVVLLASIEAAAEEGVRRVEFLGGGERYKVELATGFQPLYQALGLPATLQGRAAVLGARATVETRLRLKRSERLHALYLNGLAPLRRRLRRS